MWRSHAFSSRIDSFADLIDIAAPLAGPAPRPLPPAGTSSIFTGTSGDDHRAGTNVDDTFDMTQGGEDTVNGKDGFDLFLFGDTFDAGDAVRGGVSIDTLDLTGFAGTITGAMLSGVEDILLHGGGSYNITVTDDVVAGHDTLQIATTGFTDPTALSFDGSAETQGRFEYFGQPSHDYVIGGAGDDLIEGGGYYDYLVGGPGHDTFAYLEDVSDSTSILPDLIADFDARADGFLLQNEVSAVDPMVRGGRLRGSHFDSDLAAAVGPAQMGVHDAVLFRPHGASYHGYTFLIIDHNAVAGYQAREDFVINLGTEALHLGQLSVANFDFFF